MGIMLAAVAGIAAGHAVANAAPEPASLAVSGAAAGVRVTVIDGAVPENVWQCLVGMGHQGDPDDHREALVSVPVADVEWCQTGRKV